MKLWGGRFTKMADTFANHFHSSISFDKRLYRQDIKGSIAHADMLGRQGIIPKENSELIVKNLLEILNDIENGAVSFEENAEDIHMNIETILISRIGDIGKQLHTGRSRNDQVALDMRMYVKEEIIAIQALLTDLTDTLVSLAENGVETIMPGYTHLQPAQPITFAHHMLAYAEMFKRDYDRLADSYKRTDSMPLGSGALASTTYPLDREYVAKALGFEKLTLNSLDAVSDRDFCIEFLNGISITMMHLSRFCEELIIWSSNEFKFIELDDSYSTGSSIMPQKKNPDMAELIRGKTGRTYGNLIGLLTVMKGLPLAYNKDMQEDKELVFDSIDTIKMCLPVMDGMLKTMTVKSENMLSAVNRGFINATDAADWLTKKGVPFRNAHEITGKLVLYCIDNNKTLEQLTIDEYKSFSPVFDESVLEAIDPRTCVDTRNVCGGPSKDYIRLLINDNKEYLKKIRSI